MVAAPRLRLLQHVLGGLGLLLLVVLGATLRFGTSVSDPNFDAQHPEGMLKSDPALLYYITERILEAGGGTPADFRADPRVQHPGLTDIPAEFTVGQEFLVAWARLVSGSTEPLHTFAQRVMSWCAAGFVIGIYLLVLGRTKSVIWALLTTLFTFCIAANYRTIGYILVREDLSLPLFALHLGLMAVAAQRRTRGWFLAAGLAVGAALATWHAMGFLVTVALAVAACGLFTSRQSLFELPGARMLLWGPLLAGGLVPALRSSGFLLSPAVTLLAVLVGASLMTMRQTLTTRARLAWGGAFGLGHVLLSFVIKSMTDMSSAYSHVHEVLLAKLLAGGTLPADPRAISFDARLLWQGPFETLPIEHIRAWLGWPALAIFAACLALVCVRRFHRKGEASTAPPGGFELWLILFAIVSFPMAWLFGRLIVVPAMLLPAAFACTAARDKHALKYLGLAAILTYVQAFPTGSSLKPFLENHSQSWYLPAGRQAEIAQLVHWVGENLDPAEPIAGDFMNSTALLAHTGNPICLQPKYETERSRRAAEAFLDAFFRGTPQEFRMLLVERFDVRYVVIDRYTLGILSKYTAGLGQAESLGEGTAAEVFTSLEGERLRGVEGFELVYRSGGAVLQSNGEPYDFFRVYALE